MLIVFMMNKEIACSWNDLLFSSKKALLLNLYVNIRPKAFVLCSPGWRGGVIIAAANETEDSGFEYRRGF
jgi:hypothetical protein